MFILAVKEAPGGPEGTAAPPSDLSVLLVLRCALFLSLSPYANAGTFREKLKHFIACVSCSVEGPTGGLVVVPRDDTVMCSQICVFQKLIEKGCRLLR